MSWEDNIRRVEPYVPGEQPADGEKVIKLNTNEMPYPPSPKVFEALKAFDASTLRLYPAADVGPLRDALAEHYGFDHDEVFVGVGSDDVEKWKRWLLQVCLITSHPLLQDPPPHTLKKS